MHWRAIMRLFGMLLMLYSLTFLPSLIIALVCRDGEAVVFSGSLLLTLAAGLALWLPNIQARHELKLREGSLIVALFWGVLGGLGALPFILGLHLGVTDAIFESVSGFTTTGATVMVGLDHMPPSIVYHRQQINWLGGMGFVVLAVAVLPMLGLGGMQLYRAEISGVTKEEKLTPRIAETARSLWTIYVALTVACALAFWVAGMSPFDAVGHAFATLATGGFSTHDANLAYFHSPLIEAIAILFMLAGGANFAIHYLALHAHDPGRYLRDPEVRTYGAIFLGSALFISASLYWNGTYPSPLQALRYGTFQVASVLTNTGFSTATFADWPLHLPLVLIVLSFTGGCVGSTAGGLKVFRVILLTKLALRQLFQVAHPRAVSVVKLGHKRVSQEAVYSVWGFYVLYMATALLLTVAMMATGLNLETAFGAVAATINTLGPGLGKVAANFNSIPPTAKWLGIVAMLVGRLEVFTVLVLFMPSYWRH